MKLLRQKVFENMNNHHDALSSLLLWAETMGWIQRPFDAYINAYNRLFKHKFKVTDHTHLSKDASIDILVEFGYQSACYKKNTISERDAFEAAIYDVVMPSISNFRHSLSLPATENDLISLYQLSVAANYIKEKRNQQNVSWTHQSTYGEIILTINLAKPEKDPKDIEKAKDLNAPGQPKCVICKENEGNYWNARKNLRLIPLKLNKSTWYFQYSPYAYYPYHCIILHEDHIPMIMNKDIFQALSDFVDLFPNFIIGSNAELSIVGGSILNHLHFQGGKYQFPIERATSISRHSVDDIIYEQLNWPLSTIKISSSSKDNIIEAVNNLYQRWLSYENKALGIIPYTQTNHQTITPILRKQNEMYIAYVILRNNRTSDAFPHGIFHPNETLFHIKKENIGLIEAMGLAVLPGRLKSELELVEQCLEKGQCSDKDIEKHATWIETLRNIKSRDIHEEVGKKFIHVLEDAGVFKQNEEGQQAFYEFMQLVIHKPLQIKR